MSACASKVSARIIPTYRVYGSSFLRKKKIVTQKANAIRPDISRYVMAVDRMILARPGFSTNSFTTMLSRPRDAKGVSMPMVASK